jgi:hypothetical protein
MNHRELLGLIRKEGEISEEVLLDKARLAEISTNPKAHCVIFNEWVK